MKYAFLILTGGKGSRLYPLTKDYPKPYLPIYFDDKIYRMIDIPLMFCQEHNIPMYVALDYKSDKLEYLKEYPNLKFIYTRNDNLCSALKECLNYLKEDNITHYSVYAGDFLIPKKVILDMIKYLESYEKVILCAKNANYSKIKIDNNDTLTDLTFHVSSLESGIKTFSNINNVNDIWKDKKNIKIKKFVTDINNIDMGTKDTYFEVLRKFNQDKVDINGNIVFPGALINDNSKNIVALPNSNSQDIELCNAIIPEGINVRNYDDVLNIDDVNCNNFGKLKIKNYIRR